VESGPRRAGQTQEPRYLGTETEMRLGMGVGMSCSLRMRVRVPTRTRTWTRTQLIRQRSWGIDVWANRMAVYDGAMSKEWPLT
jgi:hypothetical protein